MPRILIILLTAAWALSAAGPLAAQYLPPVEPLEPESDHHQEDHGGHGHARVDLTGINLAGTNPSGASFAAARLADANLTVAVVTAANFAHPFGTTIT